MDEHGPLKDASTGTIVYVLGAGCSVRCGAPLMNGFMKFVRGRMPTDVTLKSAYDTLFSFRDECKRISSTFSSEWENIEDLYTQAHLSAIIGNPGGRRIANEIALVIWDVYRQPRIDESDLGYGNFTDYLRSAVRRWGVHRRGPRPVIVTTNYDVYLEAELLRRGLTVAYPGEATVAGDHVMRYPKQWTPTQEHQAIEVVKLHGSVNWFDGPRGGITWDMTRDDGNAVRCFLKCQSESCKVHAKPGAAATRMPVIIPPTLGKASLKPLICAQWRHAVHAFRNARRIVIAGYSFPETDVFMRRLLAEGLRQEHLLDKLDIVNPTRDETWWSRIRGFFAPPFAEQRTSELPTTFVKLSTELKKYATDDPMPPDAEERALKQLQEAEDIRRIGAMPVFPSAASQVMPVAFGR